MRTVADNLRVASSITSVDIAIMVDNPIPGSTYCSPRRKSNNISPLVLFSSWNGFENKLVVKDLRLHDISDKISK